MRTEHLGEIVVTRTEMEGAGSVCNSDNPFHGFIVSTFGCDVLNNKVGKLVCKAFISEEFGQVFALICRSDGRTNAKSLLQQTKDAKPIR
jgi:hypothetical protein